MVSTMNECGEGYIKFTMIKQQRKECTLSKKTVIEVGGEMSEMAGPGFRGGQDGRPNASR